MLEWLVAGIIVLAGSAYWYSIQHGKTAQFRKRQALTGGQLEFFFRLRSLLPECIICPGMSASSLIEPRGPGALRQRALARIGGHRAGYAVFDADMQLIAIVEYDSRSRTKRSDAARDALYRSAGIHTVRFHAKRPPSDAQILAKIYKRTGNAPRHYVADGAIDYKPMKTPWRNTFGAHL
jgi:hypothetical protein